MSLRRGALTRGLAGAVLALALGALGLACPSRALFIEVSERGLSIVAAACSNHDVSCAGITQRAACDQSLACTWDTLSKACQPCTHKGSEPYNRDADQAIRVALIRADPFGLEVASACRALLTPDTPECTKGSLTPDENRHCNTLSVNDAIDRAIGAGLGFDGFHDPSVAFPVIALYQPKTVPPECTSASASDRKACEDLDLPCTDAEIVACGGLAVPVNEQAYDLTCASCQDGFHFSLGRDNGPCPLIAGHCFFDACATLLARADLP